MTPEQRKINHAVKMRMKKRRNAFNAERMLERREYVLANQSIHNENYGETPAEQSKRKLSQKSS